MSYNIKDATAPNGLRAVAGRITGDFYELRDALTLEEIAASTNLVNKIPDAASVKAINTALLQKQDAVVIGVFSMTTVANRAVEVTAGSISSGSLPPSSYTFFMPYSSGTTANYYISFYYDGGRLFVYSNVAQTVYIRWFNFS